MAQKAGSTGRASAGRKITHAFLRRLRLSPRPSRRAASVRPRTIVVYGQTLAAWLDWCDEVELYDLEVVSVEWVHAYLEHIGTRGGSPGAQARALTAIRGLFRWLRQERRTTADPTDGVERPRSPRTLPEVLSADEARRLLAAPDQRTPRGLRDAAILHVLYASGLRVSELVGLRLADMDLDAGFLSVTGKGGKRRLVPIGQWAVTVVRRYLAEARPGWAEEGDDTVFLTKFRAGGREKGEKMSCLCDSKFTVIENTGREGKMTTFKIYNNNDAYGDGGPFEIEAETFGAACEKLAAARAGKVFLSTNAGAFRLLIPKALEDEVREMKTATRVIVSRGPWPDAGQSDAVELLFEDGTDSPYVIHLGATSLNRLPANEDDGRDDLLFSAWIWRSDGPRRALGLPASYRRVGRLPTIGETT